MAGQTRQQLVWSLLNRTMELDYLAAPSRGGFSATRRTVNSFLTHEGRTVATASGSVTASAQSGAAIYASGDLTFGYVAEFTIDVLTGTTLALGVTGSSGAGDTSDYATTPQVRSATFTFAAGDKVGLVATADHVYWFKNGTFVVRQNASGGATPWRFFAACDSADPGNITVTVESRQDVMAHAAEYVFYLGAELTDWPFATVATDGLPSAPSSPPPPPVGIATWDAARVESGTLSDSDQTITTGATSGDTGRVEGLGSVTRAHLSDPSVVEAGFAAEFTVDSAVPNAMAIGVVNGSTYTGTVPTPLTIFSKDGSWTLDFSHSGSTTPWATGDKIGITVYGLDSSNAGRIAFFLNGTLVTYGTINGFVSGPFRFAARLAITSTTPAAMTVECDITAMTYGAVYQAFRDAAVPTMIDCVSWPDSDVLEALATVVTLTPVSMGSLVGVDSDIFHVGVDGRLTGTVNIAIASSNGGDTPSATSVALDNGTRNGTFTINAGSAGSRTISLTNDGGLTDPTSATLTGYVPTVLTSGVGAAVSGGSGSSSYFSIDVPGGAAHLAVTLSGGSGNADLFLADGYLPTLPGNYDASSETPSTNAESLNVSGPSADTFYILVSGTAAFSGATLTATVT